MHMGSLILTSKWPWLMTFKPLNISSPAQKAFTTTINKWYHDGGTNFREMRTEKKKNKIHTYSRHIITKSLTKQYWCIYDFETERLREGPCFSNHPGSAPESGLRSKSQGFWNWVEVEMELKSSLGGVESCTSYIEGVRNQSLEKKVGFASTL